MWIRQFDRAKYDIYAVLGLKGDLLTWGKPTKSKPERSQTFSLKEVETIRLLVDQRPVALEDLPHKGCPVLEFIFLNDAPSIQIPFTEIPLAAKWSQYLQKQL